MLSSLLESRDRFMAALDAIADDRVDDEGFTDPFGNEVTRSELLNLMAVHQNYHAGQLGMSRRLAGHEGAHPGAAPGGARGRRGGLREGVGSIDGRRRSRAGKPSGQRMKMEEVGLYTVSDGKITKEEFFYSM